MSGSVKSLLGGVAGAFIGSFFGFPGLGFTIGSSLFAESQEIITGQTDPGDLQFEISSYGKFKSIGYGAYQVKLPPALWSDNFVAIKHEEEVDGGKGGGSSQTNIYYTYTRSFALYLRSCVDGTPIKGIGRIWNLQTGKVIYDRRDSASVSQVIQSTNIATSITFYDGSLTQDPDPVIEAIEGPSPAFRGHAYIVFENYNHDRDKSPVPLAVEIFYGGTSTGYRRRVNLDNIDALYGAPNYDECPMKVEYDNGVLECHADPLDLRPYPGDFDRTYLYRYTVEGKFIGSYSDPLKVSNTMPSCAPDTQPPFGSLPGDWVIFGYFGAFKIHYGWQNYANAWLATLPGVFGSETCYKLVFGNGGHNSGQDIYVSISADRQYMIEWHEWLNTYKIYNTSYAVVQEGTLQLMIDTHNLNGQSTSARAKAACWSTQVGTLEHDNGEFYFWTNHGRAFSSNSWRYVWKLNADANCTLVSSAILSGNVSDGNTRNTVATNGHLFEFGRDGFEAHTRLPSLTNSGITLASVIEDICDRVGFTNYDTSGLATQYVNYKLDKLTSARNWLAALSVIYNFRIRNSGGTLTFIDKGASPVDTIPVAALGMESGENNIGPPISTRRMEGVDLPRSVTVKYSSSNSDYHANQQSYVMNDYPQGNDVVFATSAVLTDAEALELAQTACKEPHLERLSWETTLGLDYLHLEAGDVVTLPNGRAWIQSIADAGDNILRFNMVADSEAAYTGNGLPSAAGPAISNTFGLPGPTNIEFLDIPYLTDATAIPGFYVAASGYLDGWDGGSVYESKDNGENWSQVLTLDKPAIMGRTLTTLSGSASALHFDYTSTVDIFIFDGSGSGLASITEAQLLENANSCVIGNEVLNFQTVTDLGSNKYRLSGPMIRGRRGTENYIGAHSVGERFVILNTNIDWFPISVDTVGTARLFRAVSYGNLITETDNVSFTPQSVTTKPYPPAHPDASLSGNDWVITWEERTRVGGEWRDYVDIARDPYFNGWEVDIYNGASVVRTITASTNPTATYTSAQQVTDFGGNQTTITFKVYQKSTINGRGSAATKTV